MNAFKTNSFISHYYLKISKKLKEYVNELTGNYERNKKDFFYKMNGLMKWKEGSALKKENLS